MKRVLFALAILSTLLVSCDLTKDFKDIDWNNLNYTVYADETEIEGGFKFTANTNWRTLIDYNNEDEGWLTIDPASGGAGKIVMNITLEKNLTGESRSAQIFITSGKDHFNIDVTQRASKNPDNTGDDPAQKEAQYGISKIIQTIDDSGMTVVYTYTFERQNKHVMSPITKVRIDGLPREDGAATVYDGSIEYQLTYGNSDINIDLYANKYLYQTTHVKTKGRYIEQLSYTETIEMMPSMGSEKDVIEGVETHTYYFNRHEHNDQLYRTDYVCQTTFDGHEEYNQLEEVAYNFEWERVDESNYMGGIDYFNHAFNNTQLSWSHEGRGENIEYMSYYPNLNISNIYSKSNPIEDRGCYIDINYLITTFWLEGAYKANGGNILYGLLGLVTPPSFNLIRDISYKYEEWQGGTSHIEYTLNDNGLVQSFTMGNDNSSAHVQIEYQEY